MDIGLIEGEGATGIELSEGARSKGLSESEGVIYTQDALSLYFLYFQ